MVEQGKGVGQQELQQQLTQIVGLSHTEAREEAIAQLEEILSSNSDFLEGWVELGKIYQRLGNKPQAIQAFRTATEAQLYNAEIVLELAEILQGLGQYQESEKLLRALLDFHPENVGAWLKLGELYRVQYKFGQAKDCFKKAHKIAPHNTWVSINLALSLRHENRIEEAEEQIKQGLSRNPEDINLKLLLSTILQDGKKYLDAEKLIREILKEKPNQIEPWLKLGDLYRLQNDHAKANSCFQKAVELDHHHIWANINISSELRRIGEFSKAEQQIYHLLEKYPKNIDLKTEMALILKNSSHFSESEKLFREILEISPEHIDAWLKLGEIYYLQDSHDKANHCFESALEIDKNNIWANISLVFELRHSGEYKRAEKQLRRILALHPDNSEVKIELAAVLQDMKKYRESESILQNELQASVTNVNAWLKLGDLYRVQHNHIKAKASFQKAFKLDPNNIWAAINLALELQDEGDSTQAIQILSEILKKYSGNEQLTVCLSETYIHSGNLADAEKILNNLSFKSKKWRKKTEQIRGEIAFLKLDLEKAEKHYLSSIEILEPTWIEFVRLAGIYMLKGDIDFAYQKLRKGSDIIATLKGSNNASVALPLDSNERWIIDELRMNPKAVEELGQAFKKKGSGRILSLGEIIVSEPEYLGSAIHLAKELQQQDIFCKVRKNLSSQNENSRLIPKRLIQFWDQRYPPQEVNSLFQEWKTLNDDYEHHIFSSHSALKFIQKNYGKDVENAFRSCENAAMKADLFRLAYLYKMGGIYIDADDRCRCPLDSFIPKAAELVLIQEPFSATFGNNFLGCCAGQRAIGLALEWAVETLSCYSGDSVWFRTGPGLITRAVANMLVPYLEQEDYDLWPKLAILSWHEFCQVVSPQIDLPYKHTKKSWSYAAYSKQA